MARKKIKKQDDFQEAVWAIWNFVQKNFTFILIGAVVIVVGIAVVNTVVRNARAASLKKWEAVSADMTSDQYLKILEENKGTDHYPILLKCYADALYFEYRHADAGKGNREKLLKAKQTYEKILAESDEPVYKKAVRTALDSIEKDIKSSGILLNRPKIKVTGKIEPHDFGAGG